MTPAASDFDDSRLDFDSRSDVGVAEGGGWQPAPGGFAVGERLALGWAYLAATVEREMEARRGFLWLPVAFGAGILIYFALPAEPSAFVLVPVAGAMAAAAWLTRFRPAAVRALVVLATIAAGVMAGAIRTDLVATPTLDHAATVTVTGWIAGLEETPTGGRRAYLRVDHIDGLRGPMPRTVRVTIRTKADTLAVGDAVSVLAGLAPPDGPVEPGAYDFAEAAFYEGIGAYGFAYGAAKPATLGRAAARHSSLRTRGSPPRHHPAPHRGGAHR